MAILVGLLFGLIQFGLAILGWGGRIPFFAHPSLIALASVTQVMMIVAPLPAPASAKIAAIAGR